MLHTPKIGDKFSLLGREWEVTFVGDDGSFQAKDSVVSLICFSESEADKLNWIIPTKEEILYAFNVDMVPCCIYGTRGVNGEIISARMEFDYLKKSVSKPTCSKEFADEMKRLLELGKGNYEEEWVKGYSYAQSKLSLLLDDHTESET